MTAKLPQLREGPLELRLPEGVGVASSSSSSVVKPGESSWHVKSSADAQGARKPIDGSISQFPDGSVRSPEAEKIREIVAKTVLEKNKLNKKFLTEHVVKVWRYILSFDEK